MAVGVACIAAGWFYTGGSNPYGYLGLGEVFVFVFFGCVFQLNNVLTFSDLMVLGMAFPNILGAYFLAGKVKVKLDDYWGRYQRGEMKPER